MGSGKYFPFKMEDTISNTHANTHLERTFSNSLMNTKNKKNTSSETSIFELIDDIFLASETAINILNDLLHYEHIDAGAF